ncbi:MAG: FtsH protease activity modulator HflK [Candidatus Cloacimonetes bacterium]|jgi:membrane protease subunit HflK|nr:FtsH protease activity modulator HflK [Candidatus Cloacimonadota bacterium]MBT4333022.1 FtsH protease activity modulator HflK [Candidatus Cloacimonadota bacterium]MBT4576084.1 FtsH protease activity modulator HflK [Candidatus Cloacimonadota bacterium]MBT5420026.1 FtsH protease activity modulator HflK [Candidatus Cloacimonadota bacterium]
MPKIEEINIKQLKLPKRKIVTGLIILAAVIFFATGLYTVNPEEVGIIQRFGKYLSTTEPGLHFKIPFGVDNLTKVKVKLVFKEEFGFRTLQAGVRTKYSARSYNNEAIMLTGDLNIADVEWIVQYRIKDPVNYLFNVRNVEETMRDVSESVIREVVGDRSVDEVIVLNRKEIADISEIMLQEQLDVYESGLEIVTINLQNVNPPEAVQPAFNNVNSAKQEKERIINEAWEKYNQVIPEAEGKAKRTIEEAEGYSVNRVNRANGDANRFIQMYNKYRYSKTVTKKRLYLEMMEKVLPQVEKKYIIDDKAKNVLPLLNLGQGGK